MSDQANPAAESQQQAPASANQEGGKAPGPTLGERAKALLARPLRVREAAKAEPAKPAKAAKVTEPKASPTKEPAAPAIAPEDLELLRQYREDKAKAQRTQRVEYARRAGLQSGIDDDTAAAMVAQFDVSTTDGRNKFEAWRKANPGLFVQRRNSEAEAAGLARKYAAEEGKADRKIFGSKYAQRQIERNLGRGGKA